MVDTSVWAGRRVFLTGHTGFKGAWLSLLLRELGARVFGYALSPPTRPSLFDVAGVGALVEDRRGDLSDRTALDEAITAAKPDVVIHMAAQPLVRHSYSDPVGTFADNAMGTAHVLDSVRRLVRGCTVIVVTSDKCYHNREWEWGYREVDRLGGRDPYSASKAVAELITSSFLDSFFSVETYAQHEIVLMSVRAGNVIGGGDWAADRLVPDAVRAFSAGGSLEIRNPLATRPWQHVLEPVAGYLRLAEHALLKGPAFAGSWNFGPAQSSVASVERVVEGLIARWGESARWHMTEGQHPHEARHLSLDCSKALVRLGWQPKLNLEQTLDLTIDWYRAHESGRDMQSFTIEQIRHYLNN